MPEAATGLSAWESFYVIVGSSGGALIGLQFVVITLIADSRNLTTGGALAAFGTPTVVHLTGALGISAIMSVPWPGQLPLAVALARWGVAGVVYSVIVIRRARRQTDYVPVFEDWFWYVALPCATYITLATAAIALAVRHTPGVTLFVVAGVALLLLLIGIHNAWDTVVHIVLSAQQPRPEEPGPT
jgi:hypothetical protein